MKWLTNSLKFVSPKLSLLKGSVLRSSFQPQIARTVVEPSHNKGNRQLRNRETDVYDLSFKLLLIKFIFCINSLMLSCYRDLKWII